MIPKNLFLEAVWEFHIKYMFFLLITAGEISQKIPDQWIEKYQLSEKMFVFREMWLWMIALIVTVCSSCMGTKLMEKIFKNIFKYQLVKYDSMLTNYNNLISTVNNLATRFTCIS